MAIDERKLHGMEATAREIAQAIDGACTEAAMRGGYPKFGFALFLFSFNGPEATWISNANRQDMVRALTELLVKFEQGTEDELGAKSRP